MSKGGICLKMRPIESGYPDRLCILPGPVYAFVEVKSQGEKPRPLQELAFKELRALGCSVYVVDCKAAVDNFVEALCLTQYLK